MSLADELDQMRARWGERDLPIDDWFPTPPSWAAKDPAYDGTQALRLWTAGQIDWGWVLMANDLCWEPGAVVAPGVVLFSDDPQLRRDPTDLESVSQRIWAVRRSEEAVAGLGALRQWAKADHRRSVVERVPIDFTCGWVVWSGCVLFHRSILPTGVLRHSLVPIVRAMNHSVDVVHLAPRRVWADGLVARWEAPG